MDVYCNENKNSTSLCEIMEKYGSDKATIDKNLKNHHNYTLYYYSLFLPVKNDTLNIFELGLGTNNVNLKSNMGVNGSPGASLRGWRDFFPNSEIYGADIDSDILFSDTRIKTFYCDQTSNESISKLWSNSQLSCDFDIIIDDGLHEFHANKCFLLNSFHKLKVGGVYIIEDVWIDDFKLFYDLLIEMKATYKFDVNIKKIYHPNNNVNNCLIVLKKLAA
jgi:hypothetical protein